ncbi:MAG: division/cell wall cluster transcriptional repressor MraZ, partial [Lachnospiraceae bacterium]|nr:division/cell wall cluster transcriptional repressor MraZ [Lachnospiraceae bacterium]
LDHSASVYPQHSWESYVEELRKLPLTDKNARLFTRFLIAGACTCELDKQGRILLPVTLREFAGVEKDVLLAGMLDHIEIWNEERWKQNADFSDMDTIAGHLNYLSGRE